MRKVFFSVLSLAVIAFTGCKKNDDTSANAANVTFVNGCVGTTGIDAKVNNAVVPGAANIAIWGNSGYKPVAVTSAINIAYFLTNVGTPVCNQSVSLTAGKHYSAFAAGLLTNPSFLLVNDDLTAPPANSARIRLVNLSPDAMHVTANAQTIVFATDITSLQASAFFSVTAGSYELKAGDITTNLATVVSTGTQQLAAGKIYTLLYTGTLNGTGPSALKVTLMANN